MEEKKKCSFIDWVKTHKKELIIAGISVATLIGIILGIKNRDALMKMWAELKDAISKTARTTKRVPTEKTVIPIEVEKTTAVVEVNPPPKLVVVDSTTVDKIPFDVQKHVRNLHPGYHPSPEKVSTALENGIELLPNQTWVKDYTKGLATAA